VSWDVGSYTNAVYYESYRFWNGWNDTRGKFTHAPDSPCIVTVQAQRHTSYNPERTQDHLIPHTSIIPDRRILSRLTGTSYLLLFLG
jgi:hypothetical protein